MQDETPQTADEVKQPQAIMQPKAVEDSAMQNDAERSKEKGSRKGYKSCATLSFNI